MKLTIKQIIINAVITLVIAAERPSLPQPELEQMSLFAPV